QHVRHHRSGRCPRRQPGGVGLGPPHRWPPGRGERQEGRDRGRGRSPRPRRRERHRRLLLGPGVAGPVMRNRFSLSAYGAGWSANRRILVISVVLASLLALAGVTAYVTGRHGQHEAAAGPAPSTPPGSAPSSAASTQPGAEAGSVPRPPRISDPLAFARAAAEML